jgi:uncharacterized protein YkwD
MTGCATEWESNRLRMRSPARRVLTALTTLTVTSTVMLVTVAGAPPAPRAGTATAPRYLPIASHTRHMHSSRPIAKALLAKMNTERRNRHLRPLKTNRLLARWANRWARRLIAINGFRHQNLGRIIVASRYRLAEVGENLFSGSGRGADDAGTAHITLMRSRTHRENVLLPQAQLVGIAAVCVGLKLIVVEDFGIKAGAPLPRRGQRILPVTPLIAKNAGGASC